MKLRTRTLLVALVLSALPLAVGGWSAVRLSKEALTERAHRDLDSTAALLAEKVGENLDVRIDLVALAAAAHPFDQLNQAETVGALRLVYRQVDAASAVLLADERGRVVHEIIHLETPTARDGFGNRRAVTKADLVRFPAKVPFSSAVRVGAAVSAPYLADDGIPRIATAVKTQSGHVLGVELDLAWLIAALAPRHRDGEEVFVVDGDGRLIASSDPNIKDAREDRSMWPPLVAARPGSKPLRRYEHKRLGSALGATAAIPKMGWTLSVNESESLALQAVSSLTTQTAALLLVVLIVAALLGTGLARAITRPIDKLHDGARALERGDLNYRVPGADRSDELGDLARGFNNMAEEIQRWNQELADRVDDKTRALEQTQALLARSQKMAAVGQLGAGVAHEINNPLAGLLGLTQLLKMKAPDDVTREKLAKVEEQALRIREIVQSLQRLADDQQGVTMRRVDVRRALDQALSVRLEAIEAKGIQVVEDLGEIPEVHGDADQLVEAFTHLLENATLAMPEGGTLTIRANHREGQVVSVAIGDTGVGIDTSLHNRIFEPFFTTKAAWDGKGLGLSLVNQIVQSHKGEISLQSKLGEGATFTVSLPAAQKRVLA